LELIKHQLKILIIGDGDLEILEKINMVKAHKVEHLKQVPNPKLPVLLNKSKIYVLLSKFEGNPKTLLEAMSCGLPVLGNNASGISDIIINNKNGLLINNDPHELKYSIESILSNEQLSQSLGKNARGYIIENFNIDKIKNEEVQLIKRLILN